MRPPTELYAVGGRCMCIICTIALFDVHIAAIMAIAIANFDEKNYLC
jgi:hypothetical protein